MKTLTGKLLSDKVHLLKANGKGQLASRCGSERRVWGFKTDEQVTCEKCRNIQQAMKPSESQKVLSEIFS
tara:strand:- start:196 stop:405 length:210 start_codon:yes stop_codon:yes gene_type:complete